jgi:hypothetical protein
MDAGHISVMPVKSREYIAVGVEPATAELLPSLQIFRNMIRFFVGYRYAQLTLLVVVLLLPHALP